MQGKCADRSSIHNSKYTGNQNTSTATDSFAHSQNNSEYHRDSLTNKDKHQYNNKPRVVNKEMKMGVKYTNSLRNSHSNLSKSRDKRDLSNHSQSARFDNSTTASSKSGIKPSLSRKNIPSTTRLNQESITTPKVKKETIGSISNTTNLSCNINIGKLNSHTRTSSHDERPKISLNDLKSPLGDVHVYSNQSNSNSRVQNKSSEEIITSKHEQDNMRILSNTNLFSQKDTKYDSGQLIEQLSKSELKTNPEFMEQLNRLISQHSTTDVKE